MAIFSYRKAALRKLTREVGVYILSDLDNVPLYVGQSVDGIRQRVNRHLTSARSDIIANRQIDVWEVAYVWAYPVEDKIDIGPLEAALFHHYHATSALMNGTIPPPSSYPIPENPAQVVKVMDDEEMAARKQPALRLPRQASHYTQIVGHFLSVKNSSQIAGAMDAHFQRLSRYHAQLLGISEPEPDGDGG